MCMYVYAGIEITHHRHSPLYISYTYYTSASPSGVFGSFRIEISKNFEIEGGWDEVNSFSFHS